ncbi:MAG: sce7726 family protein [Solirubrobacterales bacterium]
MSASASKQTRGPETEATFATEAIIRETIRAAHPAGAGEIWIDEFSVPGTKERVDLALVGAALTAFEIKTERDDLRRLPRQLNAFSRLFDHCSVVVAEKHLAGCELMLPEWWGISVASFSSTGVVLDRVRGAGSSPESDPVLLVRLLWKGEVEQAVKEIAAPSPPQASRQVLWAVLLQHGSPGELKRLVCKALRSRDGASAKLPSNRFNVRRPAVDP